MKHKYSTMVVDDIEVTITQKKMKTLRMRICPKKGDVQVSAPVYVLKKDIRHFISANLTWIKQQKIKLIAPIIEVKPFFSGEKITVLDDVVELHIQQAKARPSVVFKKQLDGRPILTLSLINPDDHSEQINLLEKWQRQYLKQKIEGFLNHYQAIMGVNVSFFGVKKMRTRWGSCNIQRQRIWIGFDLINKHLHCLEYVVVHELAHLLETNHTPRFWRIVERYLPQWKHSHNYLKGNK